MDRLQNIFQRCGEEKRRALVIFNSCGFPDMETSETLIRKSIESGADIIELGVPFSDPIADGATIQKASQTALANGVTLYCYERISPPDAAEADYFKTLFAEYDAQWPEIYSGRIDAYLSGAGAE